MPEINRSEHSKQTRQEPETHLKATTITSLATRGLVHSPPTGPSGDASGKGLSGRRTSGSLSPPADSPNSCWSASTSTVFPAAWASSSVGTTGWCFCGVTSPKNSSTTRGCVPRVHGHGQASGVCSHGAVARGCGHGVCSRISLCCSGSVIGCSSTMVSLPSPSVFTISP